MARTRDNVRKVREVLEDLADCLQDMPTDNIYVANMIRLVDGIDLELRRYLTSSEKTARVKILLPDGSFGDISARDYDLIELARNDPEAFDKYYEAYRTAVDSPNARFLRTIMKANGLDDALKRASLYKKEVDE